jgi:acyl carrier protein
MENKAMERTLYRVLRKTGVHREQISPDASFDDDLNFDQLDWTLFIYYLEGFFKIELEEKEIGRLSRVNDTLKILKEHTKS